MMKIDSLMRGATEQLFYTPDFRRVLEDHRLLLAASPNTIVLSVESNDAYRFESNFYGLLVHLNVPHYLHWLVMRMVGYASPMDAKRDLTTIYLPNVDEVQRIRSQFMTSL